MKAALLTRAQSENSTTDRPLTEIRKREEPKGLEAFPGIRSLVYNVLTDDIKELNKPITGFGKREAWWTEFSGKNEYEAKRRAGSYASQKGDITDRPMVDFMKTLEGVAVATGRGRAMFEAIELAQEITQSATGFRHQEIESLITAHVMFAVVQDLNFSEKSTCRDTIEDRLSARRNGYIPLISVNGELLVCKVNGLGIRHD